MELSDRAKVFDGGDIITGAVKIIAPDKDLLMAAMCCLTLATHSLSKALSVTDKCFNNHVFCPVVKKKTASSAL